MKAIVKIAVSALGFVLASCTPAIRTQSSSIAELCAVVEKPEQFDGDLITIKAVAMPTTHYVIALYDSNCSDKKVALAIPSKLESDQKLDVLRSIIWIDDPALTSRALVQITGRFMWRPDDVPARILSLTRIDAVEKIAPEMPK